MKALLIQMVVADERVQAQLLNLRCLMEPSLGAKPIANAASRPGVHVIGPKGQRSFTVHKWQ